MSMTVCLACGTDVRDGAVTCPGCGMQRAVNNTLARRLFVVATGFGVLAVIAPLLLGTEAAWIRPLSILVLAIVAGSMIWIIPAIVDGQRRQAQSACCGKSSEYVPTRDQR